MKGMTVDEEKKFSIESFSKSGEKVKVTKTDHNMLLGSFDITINEKVLEPRKEIFKYNDIDGQKRFKELTSKDTLSNWFD